MLTAGKQFVRHVVPAVIKPIRVIWNEIIAFIFIVLAIVMGFNTWRKFDQGQDAGSPVLLIAGGGFSAMLLYFGLSSYLRARRISRS